jgi:hypothetical protein
MHAPSASSCDIGFRVGTVIGHDRNRWGRVAVADSYIYCGVPFVPPYFRYLYILLETNVRFELANLFSKCPDGIELYRPNNRAVCNIIGT